MPRLGTPVGAWAAALAALEAPAARPQHHDIVADAAQLPIRRVAVPGPRRDFKKSGRCPEGQHSAARSAGAAARSHGSARGG